MTPTSHIVLDIGHANGTGCAGNGLQEHAVNVALADLLHAELHRRGFAVTIVDFPNLDNAADLRRTIATCNAIAPDFILSLHCDSAERLVGYDAEGKPIYEPNPQPHGAHVCYYSRTGLAMATAIAAELCPLLPGRAEQTMHRPGLAILSKTDAPAVLIESGFLPNVHDSSVLRLRLAGIAFSIARGVAKYFTLAA